MNKENQEGSLPSFPLPGETMKAGRELDALVAEKVMGLTPEVIEERCRQKYRVWARANQGRGTLGNETWDKDAEDFRKDDFRDWEIPHFSTKVSDAWLVVEKLREDGWVIGINIDDEPWSDSAGGDTHGCSLLGCNRGRTDATLITEYADTTPLAICLAALASRVPENKEGK